MIFDSGYIEVKTTTGGGLINGIPVEASEDWGNKTPCHIVENLHNNKGNYKDGEFTQFAFTIYFPLQIFEAKRIRLTDNRNRVLGEFEVQSIQFLDLVNRVKIIV